MSEAELYRFFVANSGIKYSDLIDDCQGMIHEDIIEAYAKLVHAFASRMCELAK